MLKKIIIQIIRKYQIYSEIFGKTIVFKTLVDFFSKLRNVLTMRVIKFLQEKASKNPEEYLEFYQDYQSFLKEGVITSNDTSERVSPYSFFLIKCWKFLHFQILNFQEGIGKLLRYESSACKAGESTTFAEYRKRMADDQKEIFYLTAPK